MLLYTPAAEELAVFSGIDGVRLLGKDGLCLMTLVVIDETLFVY